FLESVYQEALEKEFLLQNIPFKRQIEIEISYKDQVLDHKYRADLICYDTIILELKACKAIEPIHRAQVMNYLKATKMKLGLLINFNSFPGVKIERIVR
ncbi:MAG: GxxExxY protein, partial [Leptospiraceae bacterium]|nr:GxxExxY protein [Leptospiraceae bacterium]